MLGPQLAGDAVTYPFTVHLFPNNHPHSSIQHYPSCVITLHPRTSASCTASLCVYVDPILRLVASVVGTRSDYVIYTHTRLDCSYKLASYLYIRPR